MMNKVLTEKIIYLMDKIERAEASGDPADAIDAYNEARQASDQLERYEIIISRLTAKAHLLKDELMQEGHSSQNGDDEITLPEL